MTITEFIEARLAEDEAMARDVEFPKADADGYWTWDGVDYEGSWPTAGLLDKSYAGEPWEILCEAFDPARVLAQVAALRWVNEYVATGIDQATRNSDPHDPVGLMNTARASSGEAILRHIAAIWANHADYDQEWRP